MDEKYMARSQNFLIDKKCGILHPSGDACEQCLLNGKINSAFVAWEFREISCEIGAYVTGNDIHAYGCTTECVQNDDNVSVFLPLAAPFPVPP